LLHVGGVYVDHDVHCVKPLDVLQETHDFFCGLDPLGPTVLSSSVNPSPHLLAATPQHPILGAAKKWMIREWDRLEEQYPGSDFASIYNRVQHRAFRALSIGIKEAHSRAGRKDVVFPPDYFSLAKGKNALFAIHHHSGSWHTKLAGAEQKVEKLFTEVKEELSRTFVLALVLIGANVGFGIFLLYRQLRVKNRRPV
jgi:mannosyltransferase OCH1-like enzyme